MDNFEKVLFFVLWVVMLCASWIINVDVTQKLILLCASANMFGLWLCLKTIRGK